MLTAIPIDSDRRLLITATTVVGGAGLAASAVPFVASLAPSERIRALAAPVEVELQGMLPGELRVVEWRGKPMFVLRRSLDMLDSLARNDDLLADPSSRRSIQPAYASNAVRSVRPDIVVLEAVCTHLGCIPTFRPTPGAVDIGASWPGCFYCPCHGSKFDFAGRVFKSVPAPTNLTVPPYLIASDSKLLIGIDVQT
jgi:ubiquinol-cytochrome c reductase iron-sulfur subunit